jgi:hypothetical protein
MSPVMRTICMQAVNLIDLFWTQKRKGSRQEEQAGNTPMTIKQLAQKSSNTIHAAIRIGAVRCSVSSITALLVSSAEYVRLALLH